MVSEGTVAARTHIYWQDTANYGLTLESYDRAGRLVESKEAGRPQDRVAFWTTESLPYADGMTYMANLLNADGERIADETENVRGGRVQCNRADQPLFVRRGHRGRQP